MDWFLIIVILILAVVLLGVNFYLLALYCHPEDRGWGSSLFCKILVVIGLTLSWAQVLVLPLDVANSQGTADAGLDVQVLWFIIYILIVVMVAILIPFAMFMYEDDDEKGKANRCFTAICYSLVTIFVLAAILFITYIFFRYADIPLKLATKSIDTWEDSTTQAKSTSGQTTKNQNVEYEVSFPIYCMAIMAFVGWFFFAIFGGVGLSALPIDLIRDFYYRPKMRSSQEAKQVKTKLKEETTKLIEMGKTLQDEEKNAEVETGFFNKRKAKGKVSQSMKRFKVAVFNLEKAHGFLNNMLIGLKGGAGFLATGLFAFFSIYLLWCTTKGTLKMGLRIFCFTIHPMKVNETWMNSFLFNVQLVLISSVAVTQFCTKAFSQYARLTDIDLMFNGQIRYLRFFTYFNDNQVFEIILVAWSAVVAIFLAFTAPKREGVLQEIDALKKAKFKA